MNVKILLMDSENSVSELICLAVEVGWPDARVLYASTGKQGLYILEKEEPDIILLDLNLPDTNSFEILKEIRLFSSVPIIALSIRNDEQDVVRALSRGADDYIVKPLRQMELLARIKTILRRLHLSDDETFSFANMHFMPGKHKIIKNGRDITLTATESTILHKLIQNKRKCVTYQSLAQVVWSDYHEGSENSIRMHIRSLRKKLEDGLSSPKLIITRHGQGYLLQV